jgi:hypothetical protein
VRPHTHTLARKEGEERMLTFDKQRLVRERTKTDPKPGHTTADTSHTVQANSQCTHPWRQFTSDNKTRLSTQTSVSTPTKRHQTSDVPMRSCHHVWSRGETSMYGGSYHGVPRLTVEQAGRQRRHQSRTRCFSGVPWQPHTSKGCGILR